ncbi:MAG: sensor histidine kinase [Paenibacillaceae bacterium]|nr:sensor histidine kinase [Paenibacillaceae bacterium]
MLLRLRMNRIRYKLALLILLFSLTLLVTVMYIAYHNSTGIIRDQSVGLNNKLVELGKNNLETSISEVDNIFRSIYLNKEFGTFIRFHEAVGAGGTQDDYAVVQSYTDIKNMLHTYLNTRQYIFSMVYFDRNGYLVYTTRTEAGYSRFDTGSLPDGVLDTLTGLQPENGQAIVPTRGHLPLDFKVTPQDEKVYGIARHILDVDHGFATLGTLFIHLDMTTLRKISSEIRPYPDAVTYIVAGDGTIVYESTEKRIGGKLEEAALKKLNAGSGGGKSQLALNGSRWTAVYTTSETLGWKVVNFIPQQEYAAGIAAVTNSALLIVLLGALFTVLVTYLVSRYISGPIEGLTRVINRIDIGSLELRADVSSRDEIGILARSFNRLMAKLNNAITNEYEARIRQQEAEMRALLAQINPHFLYNVLQSIGAIAHLHGIGEIVVMAKSLGRMMRYNIRTSENLVTVGEEIEHVGSYLAIQQIRFGDKLGYELDVPPQLRAQPMLKFTLQPLVENAILHGFANMEERGIISIVGRLEGETLVFDVSDDGAGIPPERLAAISRAESAGIGIANVVARLRICYGERATLTIESEERVGTCVTVRMPGQPASGEGEGAA